MPIIRMNYGTYKDLEKQGEFVYSVKGSYNPDLKTIDVKAPERFLDNFVGDYIGNCYVPDNIFQY